MNFISVRQAVLVRVGVVGVGINGEFVYIFQAVVVRVRVVAAQGFVGATRKIFVSPFFWSFECR